jgi:DNA-binding protein H-NS
VLQPAPSDEPLTARERAAVIHRIRMLVEYWGITPEELEQATPYVAPPPASLPAGTVKYRHPRTGDTWDGNGPHPQWLRDALLKEGFTVDELKPPTDELNRTADEL